MAVFGSISREGNSTKCRLFKYDAAWNLQSRTNNALVQTFTNGNLTSDGLRGFEYDDENQLTRITVANSWKSEFVYDGLGRRRVRDESVWFNGAWAWTTRVWYVYDGNVVVQERWGGDEPWVNYTRGLDVSGTWQGAGGVGGLLAWSQKISGAYQSHYYHSDGNGNVTALINNNQVISARYLYDPYGNILASSGGMADVNVYRFSSQQFHEKSGLYAYAMRFYEPRLGRWLNGDPLREGGGINLHRFCGGDPINSIDPWGLIADFTEEISGYSDANGSALGTLITISGTAKLFWSYSDQLKQLAINPESLAKEAEKIWSQGPLKSN